MPSPVFALVLPGDTSKTNETFLWYDLTRSRLLEDDPIEPTNLSQWKRKYARRPSPIVQPRLLFV